MCEDLENTEDLHMLFDIFKSIFMLNKNAIFEIMFTEDYIFEVNSSYVFIPDLIQLIFMVYDVAVAKKESETVTSIRWMIQQDLGLLEHKYSLVLGILLESKYSPILEVLQYKYSKILGLL